MAATAVAAALAPARAAGQPADSRGPAQVTQITIGEAGQRIAIPDCIPRKGDDASRAACRVITEVLRADLKFEGLFQFVPESLFSGIAPLKPDSPSFED